uniref:Casein kinase I n=1 Tax=Noctiluca scintillans TaxID=2966 RepID=A0A7S1F6C4_NOCSC
MDLVVELPAASARTGTPRHAGPGGSTGSRGPTRQYRAVTKLGGGSFGDILAAVNESDPEDWRALKVEARYRWPDTERKRAEASMVRFENLVCRELLRASARQCSGCPCPAVSTCVNLHDEHDVLVMELLGPNLREYATFLNQWPLPQDLVLTLGAQLVGRLQQLHECGFVHRDLKPENIVLRLERAVDEGIVPCFLLVDYALAMRFAGPGGAGHMAQREDMEVAGTHRYMAIHAQQGVTQSRRSDLESLAHVLVYLARGTLPWQWLQDMGEMLQRKEQTSSEDLCQGLQPAFAQFLDRCRDLGFDAEPDYQSLQCRLLEGVRGPLNFDAARVRSVWKRQLQEAYLRHEAACTMSPFPRPTRQSPSQLADSSRSMVQIFVRHDARGDLTEVVPWQPALASDLDDRRCFFFEGYRVPLPGTAHVVVGSCHFFGFLKEDYLVAHMEAGPPAKALPAVEQILVFSLGKRDQVVRASTLNDENSSGKSFREWNHRSSFWSRVILPWGTWV